MKNKRKHSDLPDKEIIQKYLQGKMSPEEAHQFERQVLQDPFYQDALDGLESLDPEDADQDLNLLSGRIRSRIHLFTIKPVYHFRIAAAIAVLAVFSYFIYQIINRIDDKPGVEGITQNMTVPEEEPTEDTIPTEEIRMPVETEDETAPGPKRVKMETDLPEQEAIAGDEAVATDIVEEQQDATTVVAEKKSVTETTESVAVHPDRPVPVNELLADEEIRGEEAIELPDTEIAAIPVKEKAEIMEKETIQGDIQKIEAAGREVTDAMDVAAVPITSDADTPEARKRDKPQNGRLDAGQKRSPAAPVAFMESALVAEPVIGFEAFEKYIKENLRYPEKEAKEGLEGIVEIRFTVNQDSLPVNFQVIRSLSKDCDLEALRLLKEGSAWKPMYDASGRLLESGVSYRIEFKLKD